MTDTRQTYKVDRLEAPDLASPLAVEQLNDLFRTLNPDNHEPMARKDLGELVGNAQQTTYVIRIDERIVGMATLVMIRTPKGPKGKIDYVATHPDYQRLGVSSTLIEELKRLARLQRSRQVELTSDPVRRPEANAMYHKLGFRIRKTNVFVCDL